MRLRTLHLKNMRLFGEEEQVIHFSDEHNVSIIVGNNSSGKSSILDSIAIEVSSLLAQFPGQSLKQFQDGDIHIDENGLQAQYLNVVAEFSTKYNGNVVVNRSRKGAAKAPDTDLRQVKQYADLLMDKVNSNDPDCELPLVAYYGTGRGQIQPPERKRNFQKAFTRWDAYASALDSATNFKRFFAWYDLMEDEERREQVNRKDFNYKSPILETVRRALNTFVGQRYTNPHIELRPLRFVMDEVSANENKRQLRIEQLSDGYKIVTAMVADIASRMAEANPAMTDPLQTSGIVLIDEIDLHLHPKWQKTIVESLVQTFPNIQFIVTTHSPIILLGALEQSQFIILDGHTVRDVCGDSFSLYDVSQILLSELFGLDSTRASQWDSLIQEHESLLARHDLTDSERGRLKEVDTELSKLSYGDSIEGIRNRELLYKVAHQLGIE